MGNDKRKNMMGIGRRIMGVIMIVLLGSNVYASLQNSSASTFIMVDGNGARIRESIENYDCDRKHRLSITDASLYNMLWQYSEDDQTWTDYATTSEIEVTSQPGVIGYYRCLLTKKSGGEQLLARQSVSVECGVPETCGTIDNRLVVWKDDFSSVPRGKRRNCSDVINREFNGDINSIVGDSMYAVISHMDDAKGDDMEVFTGGRDHTGNKDGGFLFFNNYKCPNCRKFKPIYDIYKKQIDFDLCPNTSYYFMAYAMNVSKIENSVNLEFYIIAEDGTTLGSNSTNLIPLSPLGKSDWYPFGVRFNSGNHRRVSIKITDIGTAAQGNKVCIDDFTLYTCDTEVPETKLTAGSSSDVDGVCGDVTTLSLSNMSEWETSCPNVYILWQKSTDGGNTWISVPELSGIKKYTAQVSFEKSIDGIRYRAIIAKDERAANYIDANGHAEESCPYFKITNMLTLSCHCDAPVSLTPSEVSVCKGADADSIALNFAVTDGSNVDEYHWMYRTSPELAWTPIRKANGPVLKVLPNVTTYYTAYAVNGDCLSDTASCVVRMKDVENTHLLLVGQDSICEGNTSALSLNVSSSTKVSWMVKRATETSFSLLTAGDGPFIEVSPEQGDSYFAITEMDPQTCASHASDTVTFYVESKKNPTINAERYNNVCMGETIIIDMDPNQDYPKYHWSKRTQEGTSPLAETSKIEAEITEDCEYIIAYETELCPSVNDSFMYTVVNPDGLSLKATADTVCMNGEVTLIADYGATTEIQWEKKEKDDIDFQPFSSDLTESMKVQPNSSTFYRISSTGGGLCPSNSSSPVSVVVEDSITLVTELSSAKVPEGESVHLKAVVSGNTADFVWEKYVAGVVQTLGNTFEIDDTPDFDCEYIATVIGNKCPDVSHVVPVTIERPGKLTLSANVDSICAGDPVELTAGSDGVTSVVLYEKKSSFPVFRVVGQMLVSEKMTVNPQEDTEYRICEEGKENYSSIVKINVEQPAEMEFDGPDYVCPGSEVTLDYHVTVLSDIVKVILQESNVDTTTERILSSEHFFSLNSLLQVMPTQETEYTIKVNTKYCPEKRLSHVVKVVDVPKNFTLEVSADTICYGDSVIIKTNFPLSRGKAQLEIWHPGETEMAGEGGFFGTNTIVVYPYPGDFRYQLLTRTNEGCLADTLWEKVHVSAPIEDVTRDTVACEGIPLLLAVQVAAPGSQYTWSSSAECSDVLGIGESLSVMPTSDTTYYVKVKNEACEKILEQKVSLFVAPEFQLMGDKLVCKDAAVNLYGEVSSLAGISEVSLRESVGGAAVGDTSLWDSSMKMEKGVVYIHVSRHLKQETEYMMVVTPFYCPTMQVSHNVKVFDTTQDYSFTASADSVCPGSPVTLTGVFTSMPSRIQISQSSPDMGDAPFNVIDLESSCSTIVYPEVESVYTMLPIYEGECIGEGHTLSVHMLEPSAGTTRDTIVCEGQTAFLEVHASSKEHKFIWSHNEDISDTIGVGDRVSVVPTEDETYYVKFGEGRCESVRKQTIQVVTSPEIELTGNDKVCPGTELILQYSVSSLKDLSKIFMRKSVAGSVVGEFEIWDGSMAGDDRFEGDYYDNPDQDADYKMVVVPNHCTESSVSHSVKLVEVPTGFTFTTSADSICLGDSVLLSTDFPFSEGNLKLDVWHPEDVDYPSESGVMEAGSEYNYPYEDFRYDLIARTEEGCYADTLSLTIHVSQPLEITVADTTVCEGETAQLRVRATGSETRYVWSASALFSDTLGVGDGISVTPTADAEYYVKAVRGKCETISQQTVHVVPNPSIELDTEGRSAICNGVGGSGDYLYDLGEGFSSVNKLDFVVPSMSYTFTVKDGWGCLADTTFSMAYDELTIPEYFTPQGNGLHDQWEIVNLDKYQHVKVSIYDRFGKKLFETNDPEFSWDGTYNGNPLPSEDYWYAIYVKDIDRFFKGHFTLIRAK